MTKKTTKPPASSSSSSSSGPTKKRPTKKATSTRRRGRPRGAKTHQRDTVDVIPSACPKCGSTSRDKLAKVQERAIVGQIHGQCYDTIVWRRTRCRKCGQYRIERHFERRAAK